MPWKWAMEGDPREQCYLIVFPERNSSQAPKSSSSSQTYLEARWNKALHIDSGNKHNSETWDVTRRRSAVICKVFELELASSREINLHAPFFCHGSNIFLGSTHPDAESSMAPRSEALRIDSFRVDRRASRREPAILTDLFGFVRQRNPPRWGSVGSSWSLWLRQRSFCPGLRCQSRTSLRRKGKWRKYVPFAWFKKSFFFFIVRSHLSITFFLHHRVYSQQMYLGCHSGRLLYASYFLFFQLDESVDTKKEYVTLSP